jgi:predicted ribosome quality control (RQC) complex YloA/Tae2 family protein
VTGLRTTPELVERLADEIEARFRGARVRDAGRLSDGRVAIALWSRGEENLLCIDAFGTPPLVTLERHDFPIHRESGFIRSMASTLRASTLLSAQARKGDRLLRLTFGTRSRFGVGDQSDLYVELVPRFGNIVLVRNERVVAAAKEFSLAQNPARAIEVGQPYRLPPLAVRSNTTESAIPADESVLEAFTALRRARAGASALIRSEQRRRALRRRLDERERKILKELEAISAKQRAVAHRRALRERAESIYAGLHELELVDQIAAKAEAAELFARYKKLGASQAHLERRERTLRDAQAAVEQLQWEAERADAGDLGDVEDALRVIEPRSSQRKRNAPPAPPRKRAPLEVRTERGSRILIGRSPSENAELTFHVARPNDLWFHAQSVPGAHVILQRGDRQEPAPEDLERAASLAAYFSKARASAKVAIDYTMRKYVRAARDAPPGLVWYTHPRTILASPAPP